MTIVTRATEIVALAIAALLALAVSVGIAHTATAAPVNVWTECATSAAVAGVSMADCDDAYAVATGDTDAIWLYCPSVPEAGGCEARHGA